MFLKVVSFMSKYQKKVISFGCRLNNLESEFINKQLNEQLIENIIVFNTCSVTAEAERKAKQQIRKIKKDNPESNILVTGCAAQINPKKWLDMEEVTHVIGNFEKTDETFWKNFKTTMSSKSKPLVSDIMNVKIESSNYSGLSSQNSRFFLQIQNGCDHRCTFCIIPYGRGNSRSVKIDSIFNNIEEAISKNFKEIILTGVDLTSWGKDLNKKHYSLGYLVKKILKTFKRLPRLRVSSIDPAEIDYDFMEALENDKRLLPYLHLSIQHGDDLILKRMKRRHLYRDVINLVKEARRRRPEIVFGADIISGFPTETLSAHKNTLRLLNEADIKFIHTFPFSPREGTPAENMKLLPKELILERSKEIRKFCNKNKTSYYKSLLNTTQHVLVEKGNKGYTECFSKVEFNQIIPCGKIINAKIVSLKNGNLLGELI